MPSEHPTDQADEASARLIAETLIRHLGPTSTTGLPLHRLADAADRFGHPERVRVAFVAGVVYPTDATWRLAVEMIRPEPPHGGGTPHRLPAAEPLYSPCRPKCTRIDARTLTPSGAYLGAVA